jgi:hypothetical protein
MGDCQHHPVGALDMREQIQTRSLFLIAIPQSRFLTQAAETGIGRLTL